jgi:hypothetical protein
MNNKIPDMICFSSINLSEPRLKKKSIESKVILNKLDGKKNEFILRIKYDEDISKDFLPFLRLAFCMPLLNYGLFSKKLNLQIPRSQADFKLLKELNNVFSKDIFVNKILRRRTNYILSEFLPKEENIRLEDASSKTEIKPEEIYFDNFISKNMDKNSCGVLSSGGKESLLTYGLLKEIGCKVYPLYVNESGGHWRTALMAYRYHKKNDFSTQKIWANVDRFYVFMLDNLKFIRSDHRKIRADTYPIRLCVFPFYVFSLLPIFSKKKIGNLLIGSEFDDLRAKPFYLEIPHYFGVYDQHQDYDILMNNWYEKRLQGLYQWSAVRNISGLIVERILTNRYPKLAGLQRSCHSCHIENKKIVPCGVCSKCMGVLLFLLANKVDPKIMEFKDKDIELFLKRISSNSLRLDEDEKNHSFFLIGEKYKIPGAKPVDHVEKIHNNQDNCDLNLIPNNFRQKILKIIKDYTTGFCELKNENWI